MEEHSQTLFYVVGALFVAWAVVISVVGLKIETFPRTRGLETLVMLVTLALAVGTAASAIIVSS